MILIPKFKGGGTFKQKFDAARKRGDRYFWYNGRTYNTLKKGEDPSEWAKNFKDNSTTAGSNKVQTDVGLSGGWEGIKGANAGRYNSKGQWTRFNGKAQGKYNKKGQFTGQPLALRGDNVTQYRAYGNIDRPNDVIYTEKPQNSPIITRNARTKVSVGEYPPEPEIVAPYRAQESQYTYFYPQQPSPTRGYFVTTPLVPGWKDPWKK